jgi:hypothetical protein
LSSSDRTLNPWRNARVALGAGNNVEIDVNSGSLPAGVAALAEEAARDGQSLTRDGVTTGWKIERVVTVRREGFILKIDRV